MTTLELFCQAMGWQGGTIHQAKERFAVASMQEMDKVCGLLADRIGEVSDPETACYFTRKRLEANRLHSVVM